jgi:hypothetical protein
VPGVVSEAQHSPCEPISACCRRRSVRPWSGRAADATIADARFAPDNRVIHLHTDASRECAALLALPRVAAGHPEAATLIAARKAVELERFALDPTGRSVVARRGAHADLVTRRPGSPGTGPRSTRSTSTAELRHRGVRAERPWLDRLRTPVRRH